MSTRTYDFGIDDEIINAGADAYKRNPGENVFWNAKSNSTYTVYFLTDPWDREAGDRSWMNWREIFARDGLVGGIDLPGGSKGFPVIDQRIVRDENGRAWRQDIPTSSPDYDPLLAMVVPYLPDRSGARSPFRPVSDKCGVNVVEVLDDGQLFHKVLVLTGARMRKLNETISGYHSLSEDFTLLGKQWKLAFSGQGAGETVSLTLVKNAPVLTGDYDPYDIEELLVAKRESVEEFVRGYGVSVGSSDPNAGKSAPDFLAQATSEQDEQDEAEASADSDHRGADYYAELSDTRMKNKLKAQGISIPPRIKREDLIALAIEHQIG